MIQISIFMPVSCFLTPGVQGCSRQVTASSLSQSALTRKCKGTDESFPWPDDIDVTMLNP